MKTPHPTHHLPDTLDRLLLSKRHALHLLSAGAASSLLWGCGGGATESGTTAATSSSCVAQPTETAGPYPADGSSASNQRLNVLTQSGIVRTDIRSSLANGATAPGIALTVRLQLANTRSACAPLAGYTVYLWHCTREGTYSMYSAGITAETYLRGVQQADANGWVTFTTIFPGCYDGRYPHMHFEIYPSLAAATSASNAVLTSQLTFPAASLTEAYATAEYATSRTNLARVTLAGDNVFGNDSGVTQISTVTGSASTGFQAQLVVGIAA